MSDSIEIIDVTLRDGGHQVGFLWPEEYVGQHLKAMSGFSDIKYVEIGYWKQIGKYKGRYYCVAEDVIVEVQQSIPIDRISCMIDFHYCSKELNDYPSAASGMAPGLFRMTARKEDVKQAVPFLDALKERTGSQISLNLFNISNYSEEELFNAAEIAAVSSADFVFFADTHGALNLRDRPGVFREVIQNIREAGKIFGFHLHDHVGTAMLNMYELRNWEVTHFDASLHGMGKGQGNLRLEFLVDVVRHPQLIDLWAKNQELLRMTTDPFGLVTGLLSATDHYGDEAMQAKAMPSELIREIKTLDRKARDNYDYTRKP